MPPASFVLANTTSLSPPLEPEIPVLERPRSKPFRVEQRKGPWG